MSNIVNNIDLDKIQKTIESGHKDPQFLKKPIKLEGNGISTIKKDTSSKQN